MTSRLAALGLPAIATQLVGSWCKPQWLCDHNLVFGAEGTWWNVPPERRAEAQDDASRLAILDQERAGLSIVTDGEQRRQTFSGHFYSWGGIEPGEGRDRPRIVGPLTWQRPVLGDDVLFAKRVARTPLKATIIGPCTLAARLVDEHYGTLRDVAMALADVVAAEAQALVNLGADIIQIDEPDVHFRHAQVADFAAEAIDRALSKVTVPTAVHMCYGYSKNQATKEASPLYGQAIELLASTCADAMSLEYEQPGHGPELLGHAGGKTVILGVLNLDTAASVETVEHIEARARAAMEVVGRDRLHLAPDCGMWFLPRDRAMAKLIAMEAAAARLRG